MNQHLWSYNNTLSTPNNPIYTHSFVILRHNKIPTIVGEFSFDKSANEISISVFDLQNSSIYAPFYDRTYGNFSEIIQKIENIIFKELKKVGVKNADDYNIRM